MCAELLLYVLLSPFRSTWFSSHVCGAYTGGTQHATSDMQHVISESSFDSAPYAPHAYPHADGLPELVFTEAQYVHVDTTVEGRCP